jgi:hypothetical protein
MSLKVVKNCWQLVCIRYWCLVGVAVTDCPVVVQGQCQPHQQDLNNENRARTTIFVYKPIASNF